MSPHVASKSLRASPLRILESYSLQTSSKVFAAYRTYTRRLEVVEAGALARIGAEEGMRATVSAVRRVKEEEVFLAVEVAMAEGSGRRLVGLACT